VALPVITRRTKTRKKTKKERQMMTRKKKTKKKRPLPRLIDEHVDRSPRNWTQTPKKSHCHLRQLLLGYVRKISS
jgi:hypothetical protein